MPGGQSTLTSVASDLKQRMCAWWCEGYRLEPSDDAIVVRLPVAWPDGDPARCFVFPSRKGDAVVISDLGDVMGRLFLYGIHDSPMLRRYAATLGLSVEATGRVEKEVALRDAPLALAAITQLASVAAAELAEISFSPPGMVVPAAWANILSVEFESKRHAPVLVDDRDTMNLISPRPIARHTVVVLGPEKQPLLASPYLRAHGSSQWFTALYYFLRVAHPAIRAVTPLVGSKTPEIIEQSMPELEETAREHGRILRIITTHPDDSRFDARSGDYPAMSRLRDGAQEVVAAYDQALAVA